MDHVELESIRKVCRNREVDLVLSPPPPQLVLALQGRFDGYGDFFSMLFDDVEYLDLSGGVTVGDLRMTTDIAEVSRMSPKWAALDGLFSGPALVILSADASSWQDARAQDLHVIVANRMVFVSGADWRSVHDCAVP